MAFRGEEKRWPVRRWLSSCPQSPPRPPTSSRVLPGENGTGREGVDTHRPKLPVWASCRMRCSCLFIILGAGWGLRGHGGGRGPDSPRPSLPLPAAPLSPRVGGRRSPLPGPAALSLQLTLSSPAGDSAPGPQVTPLSKFVFSLFRVFRAPQGRPPLRPRRVWVRRPPGDPQVVRAAPPPRSSPPSPGGGKQVSPFLPPRLPGFLGSCPTLRPASPGYK